MSTTIPSDHSQAAWDRAIDEYKRIAERNAAARVMRMSELDRCQYSVVYNTSDNTPDVVLAHMLRWGGSHELLTSGAMIGGTSQLFNRLLSGRPALPYPPPRTFRNQPWFQVFESQQPLPVILGYGGRSRRSRDASTYIWLLILNDCTYELSAHDQTETVFDWLVHQKPITIESQLSLNLRFGEWPDFFKLVIHSLGQSVVVPSIEVLPEVIREFDLRTNLAYVAQHSD